MGSILDELKAPWPRLQRRRRPANCSDSELEIRKSATDSEHKAMFQPLKRIYLHGKPKQIVYNTGIPERLERISALFEQVIKASEDSLGLEAELTKDLHKVMKRFQKSRKLATAIDFRSDDRASSSISHEGKTLHVNYEGGLSTERRLELLSDSSDARTDRLLQEVINLKQNAIKLEAKVKSAKASNNNPILEAIPKKMPKLQRLALDSEDFCKEATKLANSVEEIAQGPNLFMDCIRDLLVSH